jgi:hypothetical protein
MEAKGLNWYALSAGTTGTLEINKKYPVVIFVIDN